MRLAWLVLCGCDSILKLHGVAPADAKPAVFFDAPADAPWACPPAGMQPAFSQIISQHVLESCDTYTFDIAEDVAFAECAALGGMSRDFEQGSGASTMLAMTMIVPHGATVPALGKLSPEGDELWVAQSNSAASTWTLSVYVQSQAEKWTWSYDAYTIGASTNMPSPSTPTSAGPKRIAMYTMADTLYELVEQPPGTWTLAHTYSALFDLGLDSIADANVSPDGLRVVIQGSAGPMVDTKYGAFYADRASRDAPFAHAVALDGVPDGVQTPFLTHDCGRLYFSALSNVWVTKQVAYSSH